MIDRLARSRSTIVRARIAHVQGNRFWRDPPPQDDWLSVSGIKIVFDGFAGAADMREPYLEDKFGAEWHGVAFWDPEALKNVVRACARNGIQAFVQYGR